MKIYLILAILLGLYFYFKRKKVFASANVFTKSEKSQKEALEILGLEEGATKKEIIARHKVLMKKNHPDQGGSDYLAQKINAAKEILLGNDKGRDRGNS